MLKETILKFLKMDSLIESVTGYVETRIALLKIEIKEEVAKGIARALVYVIMVAVFTLFVMLASIAVAYKVAEWVGGTFGGFAIVAAFYLLTGVMIYLFRDSITEKLELRLEEKMKKKKE